MTLFNRTELEAAAALVYRHMPPTPQYTWPMLNNAAGTQVWVKHENHTPTGAFKVRGGITYIDWLKRTRSGVRGICTATRGNHGQSQARAARAAGLIAKIYVPEGNSQDKNAAMAAFGGEVIVCGDDFDAARLEAMRVAEKEGLAPVPPFHRELVRGVASYALEFAEAMRCYYRCTHNIAEGAGAAPLAALLQERDTLRGKSVGVILCGGNINADQFATVLNGATPQVEPS